tara:strand:+ start:48 stop:233 length:186 start_codon:yes stop_codon:yes gene_type:complete
LVIIFNSSIKKLVLDKLKNLVSFIRTKILPVMIVILFGVAFFAVSARIWLPGDMMSPAPIN